METLTDLEHERTALLAQAKALNDRLLPLVVTADPATAHDLLERVERMTGAFDSLANACVIRKGSTKPIA